MKFPKTYLSLSEKILYIYLSKFINMFYKLRYLKYDLKKKQSDIFQIDQKKFTNLNLLSNYVKKQFDSCHILATGPSLKIGTLKKLKSQFTIGVNGIVFAKKVCNFEPKILVSANPLFIKNNSKLLKNCNSLKFLSIRSHNYMNINKLNNFYLIKNKFGFGYDCNINNRYYFEGWNVTFLALQIALALGFKKIIIYGFDNYYQIPNAYINKDNKKIKIKNKILKINHYIKNYLKNNQDYHLPALRHSNILFIINK
jgi:uncharacterized Rossmann fold enzyme